MKSGVTGNHLPVEYFKISLIFLSLFILLLDCALAPEFDTQRTDRITRGPDFVPYYGLKRRIVILDFENRTDLGGQKLGSVVTDHLISVLARSNRYTLIERSRIDQILQEQALGQSGAITEESAAHVGKLLGAESLVMGKILEAKQETEQGKIDNKDDKWFLKLKATVGIIHISYKMINTRTGEILFADDVSETETKAGFGLKTKDIDLTNMYEFDDTVLGIGVRKAVNKIAQDIVDHVSAIEWIGKVVQSKADTVIYFTPGRGAGVKLDQLFEIFDSLDMEIENLPEQELFVSDQPKAQVKVTGFIGDKVARAYVIQGNLIKRGDIVKLVKQ